MTITTDRLRRTATQLHRENPRISEEEFYDALCCWLADAIDVLLAEPLRYIHGDRQLAGISFSHALENRHSDA